MLSDESQCRGPGENSSVAWSSGRDDVCPSCRDALMLDGGGLDAPRSMWWPRRCRSKQQSKRRDIPQVSFHLISIPISSHLTMAPSRVPLTDSDPPTHDTSAADTPMTDSDSRAGRQARPDDADESMAVRDLVQNSPGSGADNHPRTSMRRPTTL